MYNLKLYNIIKIIKKRSDPTVLKELTKCDFADLYNFHYSYGIWLRNNFLYKNTDVFNFFNNIGITDIDDISMFIIQLLYIELKCKTKK